MPTITALLHTHDDALRLGRALEMLFPCDDILIVDHDSHDATTNVAREYGARIVKANAELSYSPIVRGEWIFTLDPHESVTEALAASLFEWKSAAIASARAFSVFRREETANGWVENPIAQTRLVPAAWQHWNGPFPASDSSAITLEGELLHFAFP